ncbi:MAG TPA: CHAT domain-containing protein [Saprospiraceae bacterium]|mgnify:CR=1 FL=1|nr:CHAT domain-containing protein [Saprospiraceae bacterium]HMP23726.1 CHAT domain-containing protein [Saprospiraceae bacterium]
MPYPLLVLFGLLTFSMTAQDCEALAQRFAKLQIAEEKITKLYDTGHFLEGIDLARQLKDLSETYEYKDGILGGNSLMVRGYVQLLAYDSAMWYAREGMVFSARHTNDISPIADIIARFAYGITLEETGRYREALTVLEPLPERLQATELFNTDYWDAPCMQRAIAAAKLVLKTQVRPMALGHIYTYIADAHNNLQNIEQAIAYNIQAAAHYRKGRSPIDEANAWINAGSAAQALALQTEMDTLSYETYYRTALKLLRPLPNTALQQGMVHHFLAGSYAFGSTPQLVALSHIDSALLFITQADAAQVFSAMRLTKPQLTALYQTEKASLLSRLDRKEESAHLAQLAGATITEALEQTPELAQTMLPTAIYALLAGVSIRNNKPVDAKKYFEQGWATVYPDTPVEKMLETGPLRLPPNDGLMVRMLLYIRGKIAEQAYTLHPTQDLTLLVKALAYYETSIAWHNDKRNAFTRAGISPLLQETNIAGLTAQYASLYKDAFMAAHLLYEATHNPAYIEKAYTIAEKNRSYILRKSLRDLRQVRDVPEVLLAKETALRDSILYLKTRIEQPDEAFDDNQRLIEVWKAVENHFTEVQTMYPEYYGLAYQDEIAPLSVVQAVGTNDTTAILSYFYYSDTILIITLLRAANDPVMIPVRAAPIQRRIEQLMQAISKMDSNSDPAAAKLYLQNAESLYNLLIRPVQARLSGIQRLVIIPDGPLHRLNFELLLDTTAMGSNTQRFQQSQPLPYLLRQYAVSYIPSFSVLLETGNLQSDTNKPHLRYGGFEPDYQGWKLPSFYEVETVQNRYFRQNAEVWRTQRATKTAFKDAVAQYSFDLLHFSGHSELDAARPLNNRLLFTHQAAGRDDLQILTLGELYNMRINARIAILASCDSGNSRFAQPGEGLLSLSRGFAFAGCPSMIISQWAVYSPASSEIMDYFFQNLNRGEPVDVALQKAKLAYLDHANRGSEEVVPWFWGAYIAWGKMPSIGRQ